MICKTTDISFNIFFAYGQKPVEPIRSGLVPELTWGRRSWMELIISVYLFFFIFFEVFYFSVLQPLKKSMKVFHVENHPSIKLRFLSCIDKHLSLKFSGILNILSQLHLNLTIFLLYNMCSENFLIAK